MVFLPQSVFHLYAQRQRLPARTRVRHADLLALFVFCLFRIEPKQVDAVEVEHDHGCYGCVEYGTANRPDGLLVPLSVLLVREDDLERPHKNVCTNCE